MVEKNRFKEFVSILICIISVLDLELLQGKWPNLQRRVSVFFAVRRQSYQSLFYYAWMFIADGNNAFTSKAKTEKYLFYEEKVW